MTTKHLLSLLPDENIDMLIQAGHNHTESMWIAGDQNNYLCAYVQEFRLCDEQGIPYTNADVNRLVGEQFGVLARRIRDYSAVCIRFSDAERAEYNMLPFAHFQLALSHPSLTIDILEYSKRKMAEIGRRLSVERLEYDFQSEIYAVNAQAETIIHDDALPEIHNDGFDNPAEYMEHEAAITPAIAEDRTYALHILEKTIDTIRLLVERVGLPGTVRERVGKLIDELLGEIATCVK